MAAITQAVPVAEPAESFDLRFLARIRKLLVPPAVAADEAAELTFFGRLRKFLWLSSGLFSAASFAIPAIGFVVFGTIDGMGTKFLVAIVSACLFGLASLLHFGPDEA